MTKFSSIQIVMAQIVMAMAFTLPASAGGSPMSTPDWTCQNADLEINCASGRCAVAEDHTPMSVSVSASEISVCAYSGCWEGVPSTSMQSGRFQTYFGTDLEFSSNPNDRTDLSITVDSVTGIATILVAEMYAQPMLCEAR